MKIVRLTGEQIRTLMELAEEERQFWQGGTWMQDEARELGRDNDSLDAIGRQLRDAREEDHATDTG